MRCRRWPVRTLNQPLRRLLAAVEAHDGLTCAEYAALLGWTTHATAPRLRRLCQFKLVRSARPHLTLKEICTYHRTAAPVDAETSDEAREWWVLPHGRLAFESSTAARRWCLANDRIDSRPLRTLTRAMPVPSLAYSGCLEFPEPPEIEHFLHDVRLD